jgi:hypothetical protein
MNLIAMPADRAFADAVERAIRSSAPFPPETPRSLVIGFYIGKQQPAGGR